MDQQNPAQHAAVDVSPTRRAFYTGFINGVMGLIGLALAAPAAIYLLFPPKVRKEADGWIRRIYHYPARYSHRDCLQPQARGWLEGHHGKSYRLGGETAQQRCGRLLSDLHTPGLRLSLGHPSHTFICPCHASVFSVDGKVLSGPAPRPLDRYMTKIDAGKLEIGPVEPQA